MSITTLQGDAILDVNVGGTVYSVSKIVLTKDPGSKLCEWFSNPDDCHLAKDAQGKFFIDRDGSLFRYIIDYLRTDTIMLPENFQEKQRLLSEAQFFQLDGLQDLLSDRQRCASQCGEMQFKLPLTKSSKSGYITLGYQGTFSFGRQGMAADVNFRKINRILVSGRVSLCREIFGETLNEGRDPDRGHGEDRYTSRFYLKHSFLEQAFDMLAEAGFQMVSCCASGTNGGNATDQMKPAPNTEEDRWAHYNEFIFYRS